MLDAFIECSFVGALWFGIIALGLLLERVEVWRNGKRKD